MTTAKLTRAVPDERCATPNQLAGFELEAREIAEYEAERRAEIRAGC